MRIEPAPADSDSLYFLHIPKTAGTSVRYWLWDAFSHYDFLECYTLEELEQADPTSIIGARFISGHFGLNLWDRLSRRPRTITFLREPLSHALSGLRYLRVAPELIRRSRVRDSSIDSLLECVQHCDPRAVLDHPAYRSRANMQVRYLSGGPADGSPVDEFAYDRARRTLESIEAFGLVERIDESLIMIAEKLGWAPRRLTYRFNTTSEVGGDSADAGFHALAEEIYAANSWDLKLYNFARNLFENHLDDLSAKLSVPSPSVNLGTKESVDVLRAALQKAILGSPPKVPTLMPGRYPASTGFHGDGWEERVDWPPVGRWLKWAGRCESHTLHLPLEKQHQPLVVRLEAFYFANETIRDALMITIDNADVEFKRMDIAYKDGVFCNAYEIIIPPSTASEGPHWRTIDLSIPRFALDTLSNDVSEFPQRPFALGDVDLAPLQDFSSRGSR